MSDVDSGSNLPQRSVNVAQDHKEIALLRQRVAALETQMESNGLDQESKFRSLLISEITQRIQIRQMTLLIAGTALIAMFVVLAHAMHSIFWGHFLTVPTAYAIAAIVAPIASISSITILLMIGAFRGFKESEMNVDKASLAEVARVVTGAQ